MRKNRLYAVLGIVIILATTLSCAVCPPAGPWPQPPGCGTGSSGNGTAARDDQGCFPPSCDLIPDERARIMCQQFKDGQEVWNWPEDCSLMPIATCNGLCEAEWTRHHEVGLANWEASVKANAGTWFQEPYTKVYIFGAHNERLDLLAPDGQLGAVGLTEKQMQLQIDYAHFYNIPAISANFNWVGYTVPEMQGATGIILNAYQEDQVPEALRPAMGRDLDGNTAHQLILAGDLKSDRSRPYILMHTYHPALLQDRVDTIKHLIDLGSDGAYFDNLYATPTAKEDSNTYYDKFDDYTMAQFSAYLAGKLTAADWQKLGVSPDGFNYAEYLRGKGYTAADFAAGIPNWKEIPLIMEFRRFVSQLQAQAFGEIASRTKEYAQGLGRAFTLSGNITDNTHDALIQLGDYRSGEMGYITTQEPYQYTSVVAADKFQKVRSKDFLNYIWAGNYSQMEGLVTKNPASYVDVYRLSILENYAAKASEVMLRTDPGRIDIRQDEVGYFKALQDTTYITQIKTAYDFMRRYKPYYADYNETNAKVALLYLVGQAYEENMEDEGSQHYYDDLHLGEALYRQAVDYDIIHAGMDFGKYSVLFLPSTLRVKDEDADKLLAFVEAGGTLVLAGNPEGKLKDLPDGALGDGQVLHQGAPWDDLAGVIKEKAGAIESGGMGVKAVSYRDGAGNYVVHLVTPHTDVSAGFVEIKDIPLSLPFPVEGMTVTYATVENPESVTLDAGNLVIPSLRTYGLLMIQKP